MTESSVPNNGAASIQITFPTPFVNTPKVMATISGTNYPNGRFCSVSAISKAGFELKLGNQTGAIVDISASWVATDIS